MAPGRHGNEREERNPLTGVSYPMLKMKVATSRDCRVKWR